VKKRLAAGGLRLAVDENHRFTAAAAAAASFSDQPQTANR
jgi:hypothetical protein